MYPLSRALDVIQGENNMYMGYLIPVIYTLQNKLTALKEAGLKFCDSLVDSIENGIKKR